MNAESFQQLDKVIHEKGRMAIMSMLAAAVELSFTELRDALGMTDGNLTTHIHTLRKAGYVAVAKSVQDNRSHTTCSQTAAGRRAFSEYVAFLEVIVKQARWLENKTQPNELLTQPLPYKAGITLLRAEHLGMCFGVRDAITMVRKEVAARPLTVLGELVHNATVLDDLGQRGVQFENELDRVTTSAAMITAHGASDKARARARAAGLRVADATCPLVHFAHEQVRKLATSGFHVVVIGRKGHVEVRGLTEDLDECDVVLNETDIDALKARPHFGVAAQTTQPISRVRELVDYLQARFPKSEVRFVDTVCQPTKQRQGAAEEMAFQSDVVLVVGGANSNNTAELVRTCGKYCESVYHVQGPDDVCAEWIPENGTLGITAGTSTPDETIDAVESRVREMTKFQ
ncbi:MAG: 4-hydroxy-3-methylbut-2-enyl diphosphate reductase [Verrucomicrobiota bacterium]|nr:4-hydroxy-3-methylbut-2-enyl diphosphate reductase [Verrucomicrobiota bacterium]